MALDKNEIKKVLYKEKPAAIKYFHDVTMKGSIHSYKAETSIGLVKFEVPEKDMGQKIFNNEEPAQLLIRWIV